MQMTCKKCGKRFKARRYYACAMCWLTTSEIEKAAVKQTGNHQSLRQYGGLRQKSERH